MELKIFFSWEEETRDQGFKNKEFLIECINSALKRLYLQKAFNKVKFDFQEGLSDISGTPRVAEIMMQRARECDIFIGDMTIAQRLGELTKNEIEQKKTFMRFSPNANVLMEYAIALNKAEDFWHHVVLVMNTVNGDIKYNDELFPFDIREERHPIKFNMEGEALEDVKAKLTGDLETAIGKAAEYAIKVRKTKYKPLLGWESQEDSACYSGEYVWNNQLEGFRDVILGEDNTIRLIGLSGFGKTRLVVESFRKNENKEKYLYGDVQVLGKQEVYNMSMRVFKEFEQAILVIDNCDLEVHNTLMNLRKSSHVKTKLVTIYNDPGEKQIKTTDYIVMPESQENIVDTLFRRYREYKDETERIHFHEFTGGNPMIAEQVVKSMMEGNGSEGIDDTNFMSKILGYDEKCEEREAMRALSLFTELEYDETNDKHGMLEFVSTTKSILNIGKPNDTIVNWLIDLLIVQIKRGVIERTGTTIRIRPQAIRDGLLMEWGEHCDIGRIKKVIKDIYNSPYSETLSRVLNQKFFDL